MQSFEEFSEAVSPGSLFYLKLWYAQSLLTPAEVLKADNLFVAIRGGCGGTFIRLVVDDQGNLTRCGKYDWLAENPISKTTYVFTFSTWCTDLYLVPGISARQEEGSLRAAVDAWCGTRRSEPNVLRFLESRPHVSLANWEESRRHIDIALADYKG